MALFTFALCAACHFGDKRSPHERGRPPRPPNPSPLSDASVAAAERVLEARRAVAASAASAVDLALRTVHDEKFEVTPPLAPPARLVFGRGRLLQMAPGELVLRDTKQGQVIGRAPMDAVLAVARTSDAALFALSLSAGIHFGAHSNKPEPFGHVAFMPGSSLLPDLENSGYFYVYYPAPAQLYRYSFDADGGPFEPIDARYPFEGCASAPAQLRDGSFVCNGGKGLLRRAVHGSKTEFELPNEARDPLRLLPAKRLDEVFVVTHAGEVLRVRLAPGAPVLRAFRLAAPVFAAASNAEVLAFILVAPAAAGRPRTWSLTVTDLDGQERLTTPLAEAAVLNGADWLETVTEDKHLALSDFEPLVGVGGPRQVTVWDYRLLRQVFSR